MTYPAVVLSFAMCTLLGLIAFIVPVFVKIFKDFGGKLPLITQFTVNLSAIVTGYWYILIIVSVGGVVGFKKWKKSSWGRPQWDKLRLRLPVNIGKTVQKIALARWSRTFSALYSAGVPIMQAIEVTGTHRRQHRRRARDGRRDRLREVRRLDLRPAARSADLPRHGRPDDRRRRGDRQPGHHAHQGRRLLRGRGRRGHQGHDLDPRAVMIVLVGGIVGFIVVAMYMPMFKVYDAIQ